MKRLIILFIFIPFIANAQMGNEELNKMYAGGTSEFRKVISSNLVYPHAARQNGTVGTSLFSFKVNCDNNMPYDFQFETVMDDGIERAVIEAVQKTKGGWLACSSETGERIRTMLSFTINSEGPVAKNALAVINAMDPFNQVLDDAELLKRTSRAIEKNKTKKAEKLVQQLIARYPDNPDYHMLLDKIDKN